MAQVYAIRCTENNFCYVGCTKSTDKFLKKRFREHRCLLRSGKHAEKLLQGDWLKYGETSFVMEALQELGDCTLDTKRSAEKHWMAWFDTDVTPRLYNKNRSSFEATPEAQQKFVEAARKTNTGRVHTPEERLKRSINNKGKHTGHGAKISATKKALGQQPSREAIEKSVRLRQERARSKTDEIV